MCSSGVNRYYHIKQAKPVRPVRRGRTEHLSLKSCIINSRSQTYLWQRLCKRLTFSFTKIPRHTHTHMQTHKYRNSLTCTNNEKLGSATWETPQINKYGENEKENGIRAETFKEPAHLLRAQLQSAVKTQGTGTLLCVFIHLYSIFLWFTFCSCSYPECQSRRSFKEDTTNITSSW